jgi:hypothetical protein
MHGGSTTEDDDTGKPRNEKADAIDEVSVPTGETAGFHSSSMNSILLLS